MSQITATIIKDSISEFGNRITTFELEYPRFIHGEFMTHRMFSRNAMSSRAVPVNKMIDQVRKNPAMPIHWGKNQAGMQAEDECTSLVDLGAAGVEFTVQDTWMFAAKTAGNYAQAMSEAGYHKQVVNRLLEPFQMMKTIVTATEYSNFFELRCHSDAQPEIRVLAELMHDAMENSKPDVLKSGEWHIPYVEQDEDGFYLDQEEYFIRLTLEEALKLSASCCAQVSYRLLDKSLDKAIMIYDKLITSKPSHSSPMEHQAQVMSNKGFDYIGITHQDARGFYWSGNFKGWIQYRQIL